MITLAFQGTSAVPAGLPDGASIPGHSDATLETVGLALLAYGLVQLLSRVLDKLLTARAAEAAPAPNPAPSFRPEDRKRLEKMFEIVNADRERLHRIGEAVESMQEQTRWLAEQRARTDPVDGQPAWNCRARGMQEQLNAQERLVGQALEEIRGLNRQNETVMRRLRSVWRGVSRWKRERG